MLMMNAANRLIDFGGSTATLLQNDGYISRLYKRKFNGLHVP